MSFLRTVAVLLLGVLPQVMPGVAGGQIDFRPGSIWDIEPVTSQSTIYEQLIGGNDLEAVAQFPPLSFERRLSSPVGSIAFSVDKRPGEKGFCTGSLISDRLVLTNRHCYVSAAGRSTAMVFRLGMVEAGMDHLVDEYLLKLPPLELGPDLNSDYAIFELGRPADAKWGRVLFSDAHPVENQGLLVVQHPQGLPQLIAKGKCAAVSQNAIRNGGKRLFHRCDTDAGSSGAPVFMPRFDGPPLMVALHHSAPSKDANAAITMRHLLEISPTLAGLYRRQRSEPDKAPEVVSTVNCEQSVRDILLRNSLVEQRSELEALKPLCIGTPIEAFIQRNLQRLNLELSFNNATSVTVTTTEEIKPSDQSQPANVSAEIKNQPKTPQSAEYEQSAALAFASAGDDLVALRQIAVEFENSILINAIVARISELERAKAEEYDLLYWESLSVKSRSDMEEYLSECSVIGDCTRAEQAKEALTLIAQRDEQRLALSNYWQEIDQSDRATLIAFLELCSSRDACDEYDAASAALAAENQRLQDEREDEADWLQYGALTLNGVNAYLDSCLQRTACKYEFLATRRKTELEAEALEQKRREDQIKALLASMDSSTSQAELLEVCQSFSDLRINLPESRVKDCAKALIYVLQSELARHQCEPGKLDSIYGDTTKAALERLATYGFKEPYACSGAECTLAQVFAKSPPSSLNIANEGWAGWNSPSAQSVTGVIGYLAQTSQNICKSWYEKTYRSTDSVRFSVFAQNQIGKALSFKFNDGAKGTIIVRAGSGDGMQIWANNSSNLNEVCRFLSVRGNAQYLIDKGNTSNNLHWIYPEGEKASEIEALAKECLSYPSATNVYMDDSEAWFSTNKADISSLQKYLDRCEIVSSCSWTALANNKISDLKSSSDNKNTYQTTMTDPNKYLNQSDCKFIIYAGRKNSSRKRIAEGSLELNRGKLIFGKHSWFTGSSKANTKVLQNRTKLSFSRNGQMSGRLYAFHLFDQNSWDPIRINFEDVVGDSNNISARWWVHEFDFPSTLSDAALRITCASW